MITKAYKIIENMYLKGTGVAKTMAECLLSPDRTMESMVKHWHIAMGAPVRYEPTEIPVEDVIRRLRLSFEEFSETVAASGMKIVSKTTGEDISKDIQFIPDPDGKQDLIKIGDGIGDTIVVALGHAVEHGIPISKVFNEIMFSNGTKLPMDGVAILNRYVPVEEVPGREDEAIDGMVLLDPTAPVNKILKPSTYVKADIETVYNNHRTICSIKESQSLFDV